MGKAKLGFLLAGAYALGLAVLVVIGLALPCGTFFRVRHALGKAPSVGHHAAQMVRVAVHAGSLGVKHLPAALGPQGVPQRRHFMRFCTRASEAGSEASFLSRSASAFGSFAPSLVSVVLQDDDT